MTVFAGRAPAGWSEVREPLRSELERLGVPIVAAPVASNFPPYERSGFWAPRWTVRLYWEWPRSMAAGGRVGAPGELDMLERVVRAIAWTHLGKDQDESTDAVLATLRLGGFDAVDRLLRGDEDE